MRLTPRVLKGIEENLNRISNEDKRRLSHTRKIEILGYLRLRKRSLDIWITRLLRLESRIKTNDSESLSSGLGTLSTPLRMLYNTLSNLSNGLGSEIDSYTYWLNSKSSPIQRLNNLSARIESRVLSKGETNPDYTHLEALCEICEEENLELSTLRNNLSKSILQKIEANGLNSKRLKGTRTSLPL